MARRRSFTCPHCGEAVPARALACPECGSDKTSGWSPDAEAWAGDLPGGYGDPDGEGRSGDGDGDGGDADEQAEYEDFLRREGLSGNGRPPQRSLRDRRVAAVCLLIVACIVLWLLRH